MKTQMKMKKRLNGAGAVVDTLSPDPAPRVMDSVVTHTLPPALLHLLRAARPSATVSTAVAVLQKGRAAVAFVQEKYRQLRRVAVIEPHVN